MTKCPECQSTNNYVDDGPYLDGPDGMYLTHVCDNCGCEWREEYALTPYDSEVIKHGDKYKDPIDG